MRCVFKYRFNAPLAGNTTTSPRVYYIYPMKVVWTLLLSLTSLAASGRDQGAKMNCRQFRTGKFYMEDSLSGKTLIDRYDSVQVETMLAYNFTVELRIRWIDDCTYVLTFSRVIRDPDHNTSDIDKTLVITNTITDVTDRSYTQTTSSPGRQSIIFRIKRR